MIEPLCTNYIQYTVGSDEVCQVANVQSLADIVDNLGGQDRVNCCRTAGIGFGSTTDIVHGNKWWMKPSSFILDLEKEITNRHAGELSGVCHGTKIGTL